MFTMVLGQGECGAPLAVVHVPFHESVTSPVSASTVSTIIRLPIVIFTVPPLSGMPYGLKTISVSPSQFDGHRLCCVRLTPQTDLVLFAGMIEMRDARYPVAQRCRVEHDRLLLAACLGASLCHEQINGHPDAWAASTRWLLIAWAYRGTAMAASRARITMTATISTRVNAPSKRRNRCGAVVCVHGIDSDGVIPLSGVRLAMAPVVAVVLVAGRVAAHDGPGCCRDNLDLAELVIIGGDPEIPVRQHGHPSVCARRRVRDRRVFLHHHRVQPIDWV